MEWSELPRAAAVVIEDNVWIGCLAIILRSVMVAKGTAAAVDIVAREGTARE